MNTCGNITSPIPFMVLHTYLTYSQTVMMHSKQFMFIYRTAYQITSMEGLLCQDFVVNTETKTFASNPKPNPTQDEDKESLSLDQYFYISP